jgi:two-component system NarL family response regulator
VAQSDSGRPVGVRPEGIPAQPGRPRPATPQSAAAPSARPAGSPAGQLASGADPIRVLLVDDHALLRRGLDIVLQQEPDIEVVGEAGDGAEAVEKAGELLPDVVLLDVKMPKRGGIEAAAAIKAGATGYLLKEIPPHEIADSIRAVAGGQSLITPSMATKLLSEFATMAKSGEERREQGPPAPKLTDRELEVLKLIATGANNSKIAKTLFISENTVKNHVRNILEKLQLHSRMEAVMYAVREKILDLP